MTGVRLVDPDFAGRLGGKRLTTAEVLYFMPDHPAVLQSCMWQTLAVAPNFPRVRQFLGFWRREIEAVIHSVSVTASGLVTPAKIEWNTQITLN